jgi:hypothetical protein
VKDHNGIPAKYLMRVTRMQDLNNTDYADPTTVYDTEIIINNADETNFTGTISELEAHVNYTVKVRLQNANQPDSWSEWSKEVKVLTNDSVPEGGPLELTIDTLTSFSGKVSWQLPTFHLRNGIIIAHRVKWWQTTEDDDGETTKSTNECTESDKCEVKLEASCKSLFGLACEYTIEELKMYTNYTVTVECRTNFDMQGYPDTDQWGPTSVEVFETATTDPILKDLLEEFTTALAAMTSTKAAAKAAEQALATCKEGTTQDCGALDEAVDEKVAEHVKAAAIFNEAERAKTAYLTHGALTTTVTHGALTTTTSAVDQNDPESSQSSSNRAGLIIGGVLGVIALVGIGYFVYRHQTKDDFVVAATLSSFTINTNHQLSNPTSDGSSSRAYTENTNFDDFANDPSSGPNRQSLYDDSTPGSGTSIAETSFYNEIDEDANGAGAQTRLALDEFDNMSRLALMTACKGQGLLSQLSKGTRKNEVEMRALLRAAAANGPESSYAEPSSTQPKLYDDAKARAAGVKVNPTTSVNTPYAEIDGARTYASIAVSTPRALRVTHGQSTKVSTEKAVAPKDNNEDDLDL